MTTDPLSNEWLDDIFISVISANAKKNNRNEARFYHIKTHVHETGNPLRLMFINIHTISVGFYYSNIFQRYKRITLFEGANEQNEEGKENKIDDINSENMNINMNVNNNDISKNSRSQPDASVFTRPSDLSNVPSSVGAAMVQAGANANSIMRSAANISQRESTDVNNNNNNNNNRNNENELSSAAAVATDTTEAYTFWLQDNPGKEGSRAINTMSDLKRLGEEVAALHIVFPLRGSGNIAGWCGVSRSSIGNFRKVMIYMQNKKNKREEPDPISFSSVTNDSLRKFASDKGFASTSALYNSINVGSQWPMAKLLGLNEKRIEALAKIVNDGIWTKPVQDKSKK